MNLTNEEQTFYQKNLPVIKLIGILLITGSIAINIYNWTDKTDHYQEGLETGKAQEFSAIGHHLDNACDQASRLMNEICNAQLHEENNSGLYPDVEIIDRETGNIL